MLYHKWGHVHALRIGHERRGVVAPSPAMVTRRPPGTASAIATPTSRSAAFA